MTTKETIIKELGEEELILPVLVNNALAANDRIKYFSLSCRPYSHA